MSLTDAHVKGPLALATKVDAFGLHLTDASLLRACTQVEVVSLSDNLLNVEVFASLAPSAQTLREVYLRKNAVGNLAAVLASVRTFPRLSHLWLSENPVAAETHYRALIIAACPLLVKLDALDVTAAERADAEALAAAGAEPPRAAARPPHAAISNLSLSGGGGGGGGGGGSARAATGAAARDSARFNEARPPPSARPVAAPGDASARGGSGAGVLAAALLLVRELDAPALERLIAAAHDALAGRAAQRTPHKAPPAPPPAPLPLPLPPVPPAQ
jgi:hypothetical protein